MANDEDMKTFLQMYFTDEEFKQSFHDYVWNINGFIHTQEQENEHTTLQYVGQV